MLRNKDGQSKVHETNRRLRIKGGVSNEKRMQKGRKMLKQLLGGGHKKNVRQSFLRKNKTP